MLFRFADLTTHNNTDGTSATSKPTCPGRNGSFEIQRPAVTSGKQPRVGYSTHSPVMADKTPKEPTARVANRIDTMKDSLTREQMYFIRQIELDQWKKKTQKLGTRNVVTGLAIGALVLGIYGYTFYSVSQERIMDELDADAKRGRGQGPTTSAN
ncbi:cytochrome c oxidase assembly factor 3 homolog, mitochondrial [Spinachia spinachia]